MLGGWKQPRNPRVNSRRISYAEVAQDGVQVGRASAPGSVVTGILAGLFLLPYVIRLAQRFSTSDAWPRAVLRSQRFS